MKGFGKYIFLQGLVGSFFFHVVIIYVFVFKFPVMPYQKKPNMIFYGSILNHFDFREVDDVKMLDSFMYKMNPFLSHQTQKVFFSREIQKPQRVQKKSSEEKVEIKTFFELPDLFREDELDIGIDIDLKPYKPFKFIN